MAYVTLWSVFQIEVFLFSCICFGLIFCVHLSLKIVFSLETYYI